MIDRMLGYIALYCLALLKKRGYNINYELLRSQVSKELGALGLEIKFDKPPVHVNVNGSLGVNAIDYFYSRRGQEIISRMIKLGLGRKNQTK